MLPYRILLFWLVSLLIAFPVNAEEAAGKRVMIDKELYSLTVTHAGKRVEIKRDQNRSNKINDSFSSTTRGSIQPMHPFSPRAVETIGELEVLDYLAQRDAGDDSILLIDSRSSRSFGRGTIPGSINIYFKEFVDRARMAEIFKQQFGVLLGASIWNFDNAKTLVLFCNGPWCGQSSAAIKKLLRAGYPAHRIKYYRGGMQSWESFGLTVVRQ